jgi:hypothetical protein
LEYIYMPTTKIFGNSQIEDDTILDADVASAAAIQLSKLGTGNLTLINQGSVIFKELTANGTDSVTIEAPNNVTTSYTLKLPLVQGAANSIIANDGSGNLSFITAPTFTDLTITKAGSITTLINATGVALAQIQLEGNGNSNYITTSSDGSFDIQGNDASNFIEYRPSTGVLNLAQSPATGVHSFTDVTLLSQKAIIFNDTTGTPKSVTVKSPTTITTSYTLALPVVQGGASTTLSNDGSGNLSWATVGGTVNTGTAGRLSLYATSTTAVSDTYVQNTKNITLGIAAQASRSQHLALTIPNPGDAVTAASIVLTEGATSINGAITLGSNIDVNKKQLLNAVMHTGTSEPGSPAEGQLYYNLTTHQAQLFNGTSWVLLG